MSMELVERVVPYAVGGGLGWGAYWALIKIGDRLWGPNQQQQSRSQYEQSFQCKFEHNQLAEHMKDLANAVKEMTVAQREFSMTVAKTAEIDRLRHDATMKELEIIRQSIASMHEEWRRRN